MLQDAEKFNKIDEKIRAAQRARNDLDAFLYEVRDALKTMRKEGIETPLRVITLFFFLVSSLHSRCWYLADGGYASARDRRQHSHVSVCVCAVCGVNV